MSYGRANRSLQLQNIQITVAFLIRTDGLLIRDNLHFQFLIFHNSFNCFQVKPNIIRVEVFELFDTLEFFNMIRGNLCNFQESNSSFVIDDCATFDIGLGFICQLHDVFGLAINHMLEYIEVNDGAQIVDVADEDDFFAAGDQIIEYTTVGKGIKDITMARRVPGLDGGIVVSGHGKLRIADDSRKAGLVKGKNVDVVALILLNDALGIILGIKRVHQNERDVAIVSAVQVL